MLGIFITAGIVFWIVQFLREKQEDKALQAAKDLVPFLDIQNRFETDYHGQFSFDEPLPDLDHYHSIMPIADQNIEHRLAYVLYKSMPKWMLDKSLAEFRSGHLEQNAIHHYTLMQVLENFVKQRTARVLDLLNGKSAPTSESNLSSRRRRRRG